MIVLSGGNSGSASESSMRRTLRRDFEDRLLVWWKSGLAAQKLVRFSTQKASSAGTNPSTWRFEKATPEYLLLRIIC
jgi:hypothetical protein